MYNEVRLCPKEKEDSSKNLWIWAFNIINLYLDVYDLLVIMFSQIF